MHHPFLSRLGKCFLILLCAAGVLSGGFLLLCRRGYLDPAALRGQEPAQSASAPAAIRVEAAPLPTRAVFLAPEELDQAPASGAVVVTMKAGDGSLGYVSALPLAADLGASSGDPARNAALAVLNHSPDLHTVALVSCLRDGAAAQADGMALARVSGSPWLDETHTGWLDPTRPEVQDYLIGICRELAQLGFDEILLTHCCWPTGGDQASLPQRTERAEALETFCRRLQGALADRPVLLSVKGEADDGALAPQSGQTAGLLATFARVWASGEDTAALAAFRPVLLPEE